MCCRIKGSPGTGKIPQQVTSLVSMTMTTNDHIYSTGFQEGDKVLPDIYKVTLTI